MVDTPIYLPTYRRDAATLQSSGVRLAILIGSTFTLLLSVGQLMPLIEPRVMTREKNRKSTATRGEENLYMNCTVNNLTQFFAGNQ